MNKILSRIAIAIASFAMVIGGVSIASTYNKEQAKPAYAETGDVVDTFDSEISVNYSYMEWDRGTGWKVSWGGNHACGFDFGGWKTIEEQGYSKYVDGTAVTPSQYGWVAASTHTDSFVGSLDFKTGLGHGTAYVYFTYSLDGENYSLIPFTEGEQGTSIVGDNTYSFEFNFIREAYYAIIVVSNHTTPPSNESFAFTHVLCHLYEKIEPGAERITISGPDTIYVDEDIELTATTYNFNPTEYTWVSSDLSVATVSGTGNVATVHCVGIGTVSITVSAIGNSGIVYTDPFTINAKQFELPNFPDSVVLNPCETQKLRFYIQNNIGDVIYEISSANANIATARVYARNYLIVSAGTVGGASTTISFVAKDNNGAEGCHIVSKTIQITINAWPIIGERLGERPDSTKNVYLATFDCSHFIKINGSYVHATDNYKEATIFTMERNGSISFFPSNSNNPIYICFSNGKVSQGNNDSVHFDFERSNDRYLGLLVSSLNPGKFMFYESDTSIKGLNYNSITNYETQRGVEPNNVFFAYSADDPGRSIVPMKTSADLLNGESTDINARVAFVDDVDYEIVSGAECIEQVTVSEIDSQHEINIHIEASNTFGTAVIRVKDANDDSVYTDITVRVKIDAETAVGNLLTQTKLSYHYEKDEDEYEFSNISIRFGGKINKEVWNQIDNDYGIDGFGVMITATETNPFSIKDNYSTMSDLVENNPNIDTAIVDYYMPTFGEDSMSTPPEVGDDYVYNLFHRVDENNERYRVFTAAAYIKLSNGNYLFMQQVRYSVSSLAADYIANRGCDDTTAGGSLAVLATPQEQE